MGGNYEKSVFNQLMEILAKLDAMEAEHIRDRREIKHLTDEVVSLRRENTNLREEVSCLKRNNAAMEEGYKKLEEENHILRDDNERMKRIAKNPGRNFWTPH